MNKVSSLYGDDHGSNFCQILLICFTGQEALCFELTTHGIGYIFFFKTRYRVYVLQKTVETFSNVVTNLFNSWLKFALDPSLFSNLFFLEV